MNCLDDEILSAYADGEARPGERVRVRAHVRGCAGCARTLDEFSAFKRALGGGGEAPPMPDDLRESLEALRPREAARRERAPLWRPMLAVALACLAGLFLCAQRPAPEELPLEPLLEAHHRFADAGALSPRFREAGR